MYIDTPVSAQHPVRDTTITDNHRRYDAVVDAPFGKLGIHMDGAALKHIDFIDDAAAAWVSPVAAAVVEQLRRYFDTGEWRFDVPLAPHGSEFRHRVWRLISGIPAGQAESYGALAQRLNSSARAVGGACRANPIPIIVPCHRVVASGGGLGGFAGATGGAKLDIKRWLLAHEGYRT